MFESIAGTILGKAGEKAVAILAEAVRRENHKLLGQEQCPKIGFAAVEALTRDALRTHINYLKTWSASVSFSDLREKKAVSQIFVELNTYLIPLRNHVDARERENVRPLMTVLKSSNEHTVLLGTPGAGKTTALKKVVVDYFQSGKALINYNFPILLELRSLKPTDSATPLIDRLQELLAVKVKFPMLARRSEEIPDNEDKGLEHEAQAWLLIKARIAQQVMTAYIEELGALVLFDGFDEIADESLKVSVLRDFQFLTQRSKKTRFILTSRSSDISYSDTTISRYEIAPLTLDQVKIFATRWLGSKAEAEHLLDKIHSTPFADTTIRPLTIAHLCAIYERIRDIPDKPKSVYRRIVNLLLKEWDEQRLVFRKSSYAQFDVDRKEEFLSHVAFLLTTSHFTLCFGTELLVAIYAQIHNEYGLPSNQAKEVVAEVESHNGLIICGGYDSYEFAHKSIQEFLAANYIVRLPSLKEIAFKLRFIPNELAIATALSSAPNSYLQDVLENAPKDSGGWYDTFLTRLVLEKADIAPASNLLGTAIAIKALAQVPKQVHLRPILEHLIPAGTLQTFLQAYSLDPQTDGSVTLRCKLGIGDSRLPGVIRLPAWLAFLVE